MAALMKQRNLTTGDVARLTGYSESNVKQLLVRAQLPKHAARLMELALGVCA